MTLKTIILIHCDNCGREEQVDTPAAPGVFWRPVRDVHDSNRRRVVIAQDACSRPCEDALRLAFFKEVVA